MLHNKLTVVISGMAFRNFYIWFSVYPYYFAFYIKHVLLLQLGNAWSQFLKKKMGVGGDGTHWKSERTKLKL